MLLRILQNSPIHVWTCDTECRVTATLYSSPYSEVYLDPQQFIGGTDFDWLNPDEAEAAMAIKRRCVETQAPSRGGFTCTWDGKQRHFDLIAVPNLDNGRELKGITCFILDITEEIDWLRRAEMPSRVSEQEAGLAEPASAAGMGALSQRLKLLMKRSRAAKPPVAGLSASTVVLDESIHGLIGPAQDVRLSRTEWRLVSCLLAGKGRVISHDEIIREVWGPEYTGAHHLLHDAMSRLRHRFETAGLDGSLLKSVHGVGYALEPVTEGKVVSASALPALLLLAELVLAAPLGTLL